MRQHRFRSTEVGLIYSECMAITETSTRTNSSEVTKTYSNRESAKSTAASDSTVKEQTSVEKGPGTATLPPKDSVSIDRQAASENGNTDRVANLTAGLEAPTEAQSNPNEAALARIAEITEADHAKYGGQTTEADGTPIKKGVSEKEDPLRTDIGRMWESAGINQGWDGNTKQPWSAAYISDVMKRAGVDNFESSAAHSKYIKGAIDARKAGDTEASHWGYRTSERAPQAGDLVCFAREGSGATFDNQGNGQYKSHCDIVTGVRDGFIDTIGGNVGDGVNDSVSKRSFTTDENGMINDPSKSWIGVLAPQQLGTQ